MSGFCQPRHARTRGFTLFEIMIVIAILGILVTMSVPLINRVRYREPLNQAVRDLMEVCSNARARAILQGHMTEVVFHPREGRFEIANAAPAAPQEAENIGVETPAPATDSRDSGVSGQFSDKLTLEMLDVNLTEYKDREFARVRFFPNGTSDEMTVILSSAKGEFIKVSLEITTGLASVGPVDR